MGFETRTNKAETKTPDTKGVHRDLEASCKAFLGEVAWPKSRIKYQSDAPQTPLDPPSGPSDPLSDPVNPAIRGKRDVPLLGTVSEE